MNTVLEELIEQKLYELMEQSAYEELNEAQRQMIEELSELESLGNPVNEVSLEPLPQLVQPSPIRKLLAMRIPSYAAAASIVLAVGFTWFLRGEGKEQPSVVAEVNHPPQSENESADTLLAIAAEQNPQLAFQDSVHQNQVEKSIDQALEKKPLVDPRQDQYAVFFTAI